MNLFVEIVDKTYSKIDCSFYTTNNFMFITTLQLKIQLLK